MARNRKMISQGNILVLTHWSFNDALVQTYTLPYLEIIRKIISAQHKILLVTMEQEKIAIGEEELKGINCKWTEKNMQVIAFPYKRFGAAKIFSALKEMAFLLRIIGKERISVIHAFGTPAGGIGYLLGKLTHRPLVLDSYEPHAESMVENKTWRPHGAAYKILHQLEKLQTHYASFFIATSSGMRQYAKERFGVTPEHFFVKPACVNLQEFKTVSKDEKLLHLLQLKNKIVCIYAGKLGGIYLREEVFDFIKECYQYWGDRFRFLMLTNATTSEVQIELTRTGIPKIVVIQKFLRHEDVPAYMALGDFALNPVKSVPTKRYCTSIKDGEYWATGLPVVITKDISDDSLIIEKNNIGYQLKALTKLEYQNAIKKIEELLQGDREELKKKIRGVAEANRSYRIAEDIYSIIYT